MIKFFIVFLFIFNLASAELIVWQPVGHFQNWLLYKNPKESPQQAIQRFLQANQGHSELKNFTKGLKINSQDKIRAVTFNENTLLIANSHSDHTQEAKRLRQVHSRFLDMKMPTVALPVGATAGLGNIKKLRFYRELRNHFQLLVALGGDDVHPLHYGEKITWAVNLKSQRDALEIELIQDYFKNGTGQILGFCRGLQVTSVALGHKLNQDLIQDLKTTLSHNDGAFHSIKILPTTQGVVSRIFSQQHQLYVNSYHHQSIKADTLNESSYLQVAATSEDGVIEALEGRDGRVVLFQFHPEMGDLYFRLGHQVFEYFQKNQKKTQPPSCRKTLGSKAS